MSDDEAWPDIQLGENETQIDYIHAENIKLLLDLTQDALKSQIEGVRQMFSRLGTVLAQASALSSASFAASFWLITHPVAGRPAWIIWTVLLVGLFWTVSGAIAIGGMMGAKFGAPGIDPREGYRQDVLGLSVRDMQLWGIQSHTGTLEAGHAASNRLRKCLNAAILLLVAAPPLSAACVAVGSQLP